MKRYIIILSNQKGGVGKTTLTRELGIYLASLGKPLLLVDCDPQGNLSKSLTDEETTNTGLYEAITEGQIDLIKVDSNLYLLSGDKRLALLEKNLIGEIDCYTRLKALFKHELFLPFRYIFLDTPPSLGVLTINALTSAEHLVVPMNPSVYSMQGTNDLFDTVSKVRSNLNPDLNLLGVIINSYESLPVITRQIRLEIKETFGLRVFNTVLSKSIKIEEAIVSKQGVIFHKKLDKSRVKDEVCLIGDELINRLNVKV